MAVLRKRGFRIVAAHPIAGARDYRTVDFTRPAALLVGAELHGLSDEGLRLADEYVVIPTVGMVRSLNVSVATSLLLFEAFRQRQAAWLYERCRLEPERYRTLLFEWGYPRLARRLREEGLPYPSPARRRLGRSRAPAPVARAARRRGVCARGRSPRQGASRSIVQRSPCRRRRYRNRS